MVVDAGRVAAAPLTPFAGQGFRHLGPRDDPLSGEGARLHGGRFNPPGSFPVLYLCQSRPCVIAELKRLGERQAIGVEGLLPRVLYRYELELDRVLDLTDGEVRAQVGLGMDVLTGPDWTACQDLGVAAHALGANGVNSPSATGVACSIVDQRGRLLYGRHMGGGRLKPHASHHRPRFAVEHRDGAQGSWLAQFATGGTVVTLDRASGSRGLTPEQRIENPLVAEP